MGTYAQLGAVIRRHPAILTVFALVLSGGLGVNLVFGIVDARAEKAISQMVYPFNPFPEDFEQNTMNLKPGGVCYLIVHPGYATYAEVGADVIKNGDAYGDYGTYLANLETLPEQLREEESLVIYALEERVAKDNSLMPARLRPPAAAMRIVTKESSGRIQNSLTDTSGIRRMQAIQAIVDFLKANDVEEIRVAGEAAWYPGPNGYRGCLATLAEEFMDAGFRIRGVEGCVHPSKSLPAESFLRECLARDEWTAERWRGLYGGDALACMATDTVLRGIYGDHGRLPLTRQAWRFGFRAARARAVSGDTSVGAGGLFLEPCGLAVVRHEGR